MKNYYEILEVNETASQEVIERVYKLLAKKYHPDMNLENPKEAEEKFKEVTTAYETLSNPDKRKKYDEELAYERQQKESDSYNNTQTYKAPYEAYTNNVVYDEPLYNQAPQQSTNYEQDIKKQKKKIEELARQQAKEQARQEYEAQKAYNDAYYKALEDMGYTIVYQKTFKDYVRIFLTIVVMIIVLYVLWQIPFIQEKAIELYENSGPFKNFIDAILTRISEK